MTALETWLNSALHPRPQWLNAWSQALNKYRKDPGALTVEGEAELQGIGSRFSQLYAEALHAVGGTVRFRSSYKPRAISSAHSFLDGYLHACTKFNLPQPITFLNSQHASNFSEVDASESEQSLDLDSSQSSGTLPDLSNISLDSSSMFSIEGDPLEILPYGRDAVLRYFETNKVYSKFAVNHKAKTQKDFSKGTFGPYSAEMANRMSGSFGASSSMDVDLVRAVAEACAFDYSHGREHMSMFCRVLTPEDTRVLELFEKRHRPFFKGHESFRTVAAPLVADLAASLRASASGSASAHAADLRFAHAETLVPLLLLFGIRNNGLNSNNPEFLHGLNAMSPFAGNLAFELYECGGPKKKSHFVRFRLHERYVESIPVLGKRGKTGVVKLDHLLEFFDKVVEEEGMLNASGLDP